MNEDRLILRRSSLITPEQTRRPGIKERRLLTPEDSPHQTIVLIDADEGAEVELHEISNSESIFVLKGTFEVILPDSTETLEEGDLCHLPPNSSHGLRCTKDLGQFLVIFALTCNKENGLSGKGKRG